MYVFRLGQHLQRRSDVVHALYIQVQQVEGLNRDTGLSPCSLDCALHCPSKDLAGQRSAAVNIFLTPCDIAFALARDVFPVLIIGSAGSSVCSNTLLFLALCT